MTSLSPQNRTGAAARMATTPMLRLAVALAVLALALLAAAPLGWRLGGWSYGVSFVLMRWAGVGALAGAAAAAVALCTWRRLGGWRRAAAIVALLGSGIIFYMPWHYTLLAGASIHDITTDTDHPPAFVAVLPLREAAHAASAVYAGPRLAALQKKAYPDIAPLFLAMPRATAFADALAVATSMPRWTIVASDSAQGRIEATARTYWMGFADDVVIRVTDHGAGSRVDMRSLSRVGRGDFGTNAARIRAYFAALRAKAG